MDFAAWIEVYLGGRWHVFDPRNNVPRIGRVLIAHGRDAADVPLTHIFGPGLSRLGRTSAPELTRALITPVRTMDLLEKWLWWI